VPEIDAEVAGRLARELIVWLTTGRADGQPQSVPVWFLWDQDSFLIYSQPEKPKLGNIASNPKVSLHLRGTETGDDVVMFEGTRNGSRMSTDRSGRSVHREVPTTDRRIRVDTFVLRR
jgi:PPOX class probable F420-dependent enzyme